jgi:ribosomal-protein-alanine N-acetyltransferase
MAKSPRIIGESENAGPPGPRSQPRILLRHPASNDRDELTGLLSSSRDHLIPWWSTSERFDDEGFDPDNIFDRLLATSKLDSSLRFLICVKPLGAITGAISVNNIARGAFDSCCLGYWLGAPYIKRGFATEAMALALRFIFREMKLHRCEANIMPHNEPSMALAKRMHFRNEGLGLRYIRINYRWEDHVRWAMTVEDYDDLCARGLMPFSELEPGKKRP